jgi:drug/metabolite transporter (DMT)-like permease
MKRKNMFMFYLSAIVAVTGVVGYQYFAKHVPETLNPIVSIMGMYIVVLVLGVGLLPFFPALGGIKTQIRQLSWIQIALAFSVMMVELGFLLMYRYGWNLGTGNLVTGVFVNLILVGLGVAVLGEKMSITNAIGIVFCILGVALISLHS